MDIQEMVENRIRELRAREDLPGAREDDHGGVLNNDRFGEPAPRRRYAHDRRERGETGVSASRVAIYGDIIDQKLAEVASRVLDISERISSDYGRLEQDLLKSRLEVLQSAETVLDLAMSLRRECRQLLASPGFSQAGGGGAARHSLNSYCDVESSCEEDSRASMRAMGVADLFRRT